MYSQLEKLLKISESPSFWQDVDKPQNIMQEIAIIQGKLSKFAYVKNAFDDLVTLLQLANGDADLLVNCQQELASLWTQVVTMQFSETMVQALDLNDTYLEIHSGAGGIESQDWAQILLRMYYNWAVSHDYSFDELALSLAEEAGIKSAVIRISGSYAYGWLKYEAGIHRLVRISPFDSNARRHTSFASVSIYPVVDEKIEIKIMPNELQVDTYRASGAGGQHVNKTDSAVRITHLPTKIVVQSQQDRSQHRNRSIAMDMLKSKLYQLELEKKNQQKQDNYLNQSAISWGNQIRSYVLYPYQLVKDLRSGYETSDVNGVLNGKIDPLITSMLNPIKTSNSS